MEKKQNENDGKQITTGRFAVRVACFVLLMGAIILYTGYVLTPKNEYGICPMMNLYRQPSETVDVLVAGSSLAYAGCNTNVLWRTYGIACYNLCGAEEPYWSSYYKLKEALRYQRPKLILLDAKAASYTDDYSKRGRTIQGTYGILNPDHRISAIFACRESARDAMGYLLGYPEVHYNYKDLTWEDFVFPPTNKGRGSTWKGYIEIDKVEEHDAYAISRSAQKKELRPREEEYARKIFELARDEHIPIAVVSFPNPDYGYDQPYQNSLQEVAAEYGVPFINYNDNYTAIGLEFDKDFADWQHLNVRGSIKMSLMLGFDLTKRFNIADHRGDPAYQSYDECAEIWFDKIDSFSTGPSGDLLAFFGL